MELVKYKAIDRDRHRLKKKMWERFCSKDYPKSLPTEKFLTIFFKEAEKTYHEHVRYYASLNWVQTDLLQKRLIYLEGCFLRLSEDLCVVTRLFSIYLKKGDVGKRFQTLSTAVDDFHQGVIGDLVLIDQGILKQIRQKVLGSFAA